MKQFLNPATNPMFQPSRQAVRQFLFDTWQKMASVQPLSDLEKIVATIIAQHTEYHSVLDNPSKYLDADYKPELGQINPFLHLSLHVAIAEQISIDQPLGIRSLHQSLQLKLGDAHKAEHIMMDGLIEMMWQSQRYGQAPDPKIYLSHIKKQLAS